MRAYALCEKLRGGEKLSAAQGRLGGTALGHELAEEPVPEREGLKWPSEAMTAYSRTQPSLKKSHTVRSHLWDHSRCIKELLALKGSKTKFWDLELHTIACNLSEVQYYFVL